MNKLFNKGLIIAIALLFSFNATFAQFKTATELLMEKYDKMQLADAPTEVIESFIFHPDLFHTDGVSSEEAQKMASEEHNLQMWDMRRLQALQVINLDDANLGLKLFAEQFKDWTFGKLFKVEGGKLVPRHYQKDNSYFHGDVITYSYWKFERMLAESEVVNNDGDKTKHRRYSDHTTRHGLEDKK